MVPTFTRTNCENYHAHFMSYCENCEAKIQDMVKGLFFMFIIIINQVALAKQGDNKFGSITETTEAHPFAQESSSTHRNWVPFLGRWIPFLGRWTPSLGRWILLLGKRTWFLCEKVSLCGFRKHPSVRPSACQCALSRLNRLNFEHWTWLPSSLEQQMTITSPRYLL